MKKLFILFFMSLLSLVIALPAMGKDLTIVFVPGVADPFYFTMERGIKAKAKELGVNLIVAEYPKTWGPEAQVPILNAVALRKGIDMILIAPTSTEALIVPLRRIYDRGIEIITVDTFLGDGDYTKKGRHTFPLSYIGSDNFKGGKEIAYEMAKLVGKKGKVYINTTNPDVSSVANRVKGFTAGTAEYSSMQLIGVDYNHDQQQKAQAQTAAMLQRTNDLVGVFATNVYSSQGAYRAVVAAGLTGTVKIASWDATKDMIGALKKGQVDLVLAQKPAEIGSLAVEWAYKYLNEGATIPPKVIPGFKFFTKDNVNNPEMQQYIYQ